TLMPAIERTRLSETGVRGWQTLRTRCGWSGVGELDGINRMDRAMKNVMMVEQKVRQDTSAVMRENISKQLEGKGPNEKPDLRKVAYQEGVNDYKLTKERFEKELTVLFTDRKTGQIPESDMQDFEDAKKLYSETRQYLNDDYMNNFAEKLRMNGKPEKYFPFAVAAEELDTSFLTYQSAGPDVMRRALSEIGAIETNVVKNIQDNFVGKFRDVAMHEKKFDPLIHAIHEVHKQLDGIHGEKYANEVADYMARLATAYFKRDSDVIGIFGKVLNVGKPHSIAAEFAGGSWKNVWEWDVAEQESFYRELDKLGILPDRPKNLNKAEVLERKKLFGITWGYSKVQLEDEPGDPEHSGLKIRQEMGATYAQLAWEIMRKWAPAIAAVMMWGLIRKATEEVRGGGNRH
ncbi:hypothetical protein HYS00_01740, partial [Candidatus Microgenomates bacterium]|nr:hypothetical protein [Candidatus Microgenomates bacterium]